ncbi:MAG: hypothetical protein ABSG75_12320 [Syntrophales bacterium]|jgi:hypothetical protein
MVIVKLAAVRVYLYVIKAGMAEYFCINVAATIAPKVKFTALYAERNLAAITEDDSRDLPAMRAGNACFCYDDHGISG